MSKPKKEFKKVTWRHSNVEAHWRTVYEAEKVSKKDKRVTDIWTPEFIASLHGPVWFVCVRDTVLWYTDREFKENFEEVK